MTAKPLRRQQVTLTPLDSAEGHSALIQSEMVEPVMRGPEVDGEDYICGVCKEMVLATQMFRGEISDLAFVCSKCGGVSESPVLLPGTPLPIGKLVEIPVGMYRINRVLTMPGAGVTIAGSAALLRRQYETGQGFQPPPLRMDNVDDLRELVARARQAIGPEVFDRIVKKHERAKQARTAPKNPHRLMQLVDGVQQSIDGSLVLAPAIVELDLIVSLFERWQHEPILQDKLRTGRLITWHEFPSVVIELVAASFLADRGNGVAFTRENGLHSSDLYVATTSRDRMTMEVKAPTIEEFQGRTKPLVAEAAKEIIRRRFSMAHAGGAGQLSNKHPAMLLLGGFHLSQYDLDLLEVAARALLAETESTRQHKRRHIAGIVIVSIGMEVGSEERQTLRPSRLLVVHNASSVASSLAVRVAMNPHYDGTIAVEDRARPITIPGLAASH